MNTKLRSVRREILFIFVIKVILLVILWKLCFSTPLSKQLTVNDHKQHLTQQIEDTQHGT